MSAMEILRTLIDSYLIATLGATALAKLRNRRVSSVGMQRERVIPAKATPAVIVTMALAELSLATLLVLGAAPVETGFASAALFVLFGGYRLVVAARTKYLMCSCRQPRRHSRLDLPTGHSRCGYAPGIQRVGH